MKYAELGTISSGTLNTRELMQSFVLELLSLGYRGKSLQAAKKLLRVKEWNEEQEEEASYLVNEDLFNALDSYAPPYASFGSHIGDGADFGFWPDVDLVLEDFRFGEIPDYEKVPKGYRGLALGNNDHGNMTLYQIFKNGKAKEIWAIV